MKQLRNPYSPRNPHQKMTFRETIPTQKLTGGSIAQVSIDNDGMVSVGAGKSIPFQSNDKFTNNLTESKPQRHDVSRQTKPVNGLRADVSKKVKGTSPYNAYN